MNCPRCSNILTKYSNYGDSYKECRNCLYRIFMIDKEERIKTDPYYIVSKKYQTIIYKDNERIRIFNFRIKSNITIEQLEKYLLL
jgi:DNA-directed RNA polymerase subunit RPC12/RpoP